MKRTIKDRLIAKIDNTTIPGHWIWTGTFNPSRPKLQNRNFIRTTGQPTYIAKRIPQPIIMVDGKRWLVARLVWLEFKNPDLPPEVYVKRMKDVCPYYHCVHYNCHNTPPRRRANDWRIVAVPERLQNPKALPTTADEVLELAEHLEGRNLDDPEAMIKEWPYHTQEQVLAAIRIARSRE